MEQHQPGAMDRRTMDDPTFHGPYKRSEDFYRLQHHDNDDKCCKSHSMVLANVQHLQHKVQAQCYDFKVKADQIEAHFDNLEKENNDVLRGKVPFKVFSWAMTLSVTAAVTILGILYGYMNDQFIKFTTQYSADNTSVVRQLTKIETRLSADMQRMSDKSDDNNLRISNKVDNLSTRLSQVETQIQNFKEQR